MCLKSILKTQIKDLNSIGELVLQYFSQYQIDIRFLGGARRKYVRVIGVQTSTLPATWLHLVSSNSDKYYFYSLLLVGQNVS